MPRRIYRTIPEKVWVNDVVERDGFRIDVRVEIDLALLRAEHNPVYRACRVLDSWKPEDSEIARQISTRTAAAATWTGC